MADGPDHNTMPFMKMHGLGNDFVVLDARDRRGVLDARDSEVVPEARDSEVLFDARDARGAPDARSSGVTLDARTRGAALDAPNPGAMPGARTHAPANAPSPAIDSALVRALGDRHRGVGFDQLAVIENDPEVAARLTFYNADGSLSAACGNATRCIARHLMNESGIPALTLRTERGLLACEDAGGGLTRVNMGAPVLDWKGIPLAHEVDTLRLPIPGDPVATGMGNPHCTFFVADAGAVDLPAFGPAHEAHPLYPERTNVEVVQILSRDAIRLRIWERGTGITLASGSCSCAAAVAAARRSLTERAVTVEVDGGTLHIDWRDDGVWLTGPTAHVFDGVLTHDFLASLTAGAPA